MTVQELKLAALDLEMNDAQVKQVFLNTQITSEEDIKEAVAILERYRPHLVEKLSAKIGKIKKGVYRNFKGKNYLVLREVPDATNGSTEPMILYIQLYGNYQEMVRKKSEFLEEVDRPDFNYKGPRFQYVGES